MIETLRKSPRPLSITLAPWDWRQSFSWSAIASPDMDVDTLQRHRPPDRPGWTTSWSDEYNAWYWWNHSWETTWEDPLFANGAPNLVPAEAASAEDEAARALAPLGANQPPVSRAPPINAARVEAALQAANGETGGEAMAAAMAAVTAAAAGAAAAGRAVGAAGAAARVPCPSGRCPRCHAKSQGRKYTGAHKRDRICEAPPERKGSMCKGCGQTRASFGLPGEKKNRWCFACSQTQEGATSEKRVHKKKKKKKKKNKKKKKTVHRDSRLSADATVLVNNVPMRLTGHAPACIALPDFMDLCKVMPADRMMMAQTLLKVPELLAKHTFHDGDSAFECSVFSAAKMKHVLEACPRSLVDELQSTDALVSIHLLAWSRGGHKTKFSVEEMHALFKAVQTSRQTSTWRTNQTVWNRGQTDWNAVSKDVRYPFFVTGRTPQGLELQWNELQKRDDFDKLKTAFSAAEKKLGGETFWSEQSAENDALKSLLSHRELMKGNGTATILQPPGTARLHATPLAADSSEGTARTLEGSSSLQAPESPDRNKQTTTEVMSAAKLLGDLLQGGESPTTAVDQQSKQHTGKQEKVLRIRIGKLSVRSTPGPPRLVAAADVVAVACGILPDKKRGMGVHNKRLEQYCVGTYSFTGGKHACVLGLAQLDHFLSEFCAGVFQKGRQRRKVEKFCASEDLRRMKKWMEMVSPKWKLQGGAQGPRPKGKKPQRPSGLSSGLDMSPPPSGTGVDGTNTISGGVAAASEQAEPKRRRKKTGSAAAVHQQDADDLSSEDAPRVDPFKLKAMCNDGSLAGRRLSLYWGGDDKWYSGMVLACDNSLFQVRYDDNEVTWENVDAQVGARLHRERDLEQLAELPASQSGVAGETTLYFGNSGEETPFRALPLLSYQRLMPFACATAALRVTGHLMPRIGLKGFIECLIGSNTNSHNSIRNIVDLMTKVKRALLGRVTKHSFEDLSQPTGLIKLLVVPVSELGSIMPLLPLDSCSRIHETGDLHRLQHFLRRETGVQTLELRVRGDEATGAAAKAVAGDSAAAAAGRKRASPAAPQLDDDLRMVADDEELEEAQDPKSVAWQLTKESRVVRQVVSAGRGTYLVPEDTEAASAELRWLCTTGLLVGRDVSVWSAKRLSSRASGAWRDGKVRERDTAFPCASATILPKTDAYACGAAGRDSASRPVAGQLLRPRPEAMGRSRTRECATAFVSLSFAAFSQCRLCSLCLSFAEDSALRSQGVRLKSSLLPGDLMLVRAFP